MSLQEAGKPFEGPGHLRLDFITADPLDLTTRAQGETGA
jgi:hypothetical protein